MYSVMLMMAMTSGGDLPNFGHHGCCGGYSSCCGSYVSSCCGGYGGYASSCCGGYVSSGYSCCGGGYASSCCGGGYASCCGGGRHRLFGGHHSSCCGGYSSCCGGYSGYSCCGGYMGGYSCGGGYMGGYSCGGMMYGPSTSPGEVIIEKKPGETTPEPVKPPKETTPPKETLVPTPATIIVSLPADAKLSIDDAATVSTSAVRVFSSPELPVGQDFHYTLKAEYVREGKPVVLSKDITVRAGEQTRVNMEEAAGVASR